MGGFPSTCGSASLGSLLDEHTLARHCTPSIKNPIHRYYRSYYLYLFLSLIVIFINNFHFRFRYFVADDSTLLALLEEPLANDQDPHPTLTGQIKKYIL